MGAIRVRRWRWDDDDDYDEEAVAAVVLTSSDDEEANRDLSLEIVERARRCGGVKAAALEGSGRDVARGVVETLKKKKRKKKDKGKQKGNGRRMEVVVEVERNGMETRRSKKRSNGRKEEEEGKVVDSAVQKEEAANVEDAVLEEPPGSADSEVTDANDVADNMVLRKLLRGPRYFDTYSCNWQQSCRNCGEGGHVAANCTEEKHQKPCFICGEFGHNPRQCLQARDCFLCKRKGHAAKDCPDKRQRGSRNLTFCLRCGDLGHDMPSCNNAYSPKDLLEIQCYVCKEFGHLCCAEFLDASPLEVSCYNCGQSGHSGVGCAMQRGKRNGDEPPSLCYVCGEEGHFARGCIKNLKPSQRADETSAPFRKPKKHTYAMGTRSAPHLLGKPREKPVQHDWSANASGSSWSKKIENRFETSRHSGSSPCPKVRHCKFSTPATNANHSGSSMHAKFRRRKLSTPATNENHSGLNSYKLEKNDHSDSFQPAKVRHSKLSTVATNGDHSSSKSHLLLSARV